MSIAPPSPLAATSDDPGATAGTDRGPSRTPVLVDALGERLAFEAIGVRLYDAVLAHGVSEPGVLSVEELARLHDFRSDECLHVEMARDGLRMLGVDPGRPTPGAMRVASVTAGLLQVLAAPDTSLRQALRGLLEAELVDNAGWDLLIELARASGRIDLVEDFSQALRQENRHLHAVRDMVARLALFDATADAGRVRG